VPDPVMEPLSAARVMLTFPSTISPTIPPCYGRPNTRITCKGRGEAGGPKPARTLSGASGWLHTHLLLSSVQIHPTKVRTRKG
jgi:hypothetical protein